MATGDETCLFNLCCRHKDPANSRRSWHVMAALIPVTVHRQGLLQQGQGCFLCHMGVQKHGTAPFQAFHQGLVCILHHLHDIPSCTLASLCYHQGPGLILGQMHAAYCWCPLMPDDICTVKQQSIWHGTAWHSTMAQHSMAQQSTAQFIAAL